MTNAEIARFWGCSPQYVGKLKRRGMPTDSIESATVWRATNSREGFGHKSGGARGGEVRRSPGFAAAADEYVANVESMPAVEVVAPDDDPLSAVQRTSAIERGIFDVLKTAIARAKSGDKTSAASLPHLIRTHAGAYANRAGAQKQWERLNRDLGDIGSVSELHHVLRATLEPLRDALTCFPRDVAATVNPKVPEVAERAINQGLRPIRQQISVVLLSIAPPANKSRRLQAEAG